MTRNQLTAALAAILEILDKTGGWSPSGHLHMALQNYDAQIYTLDAYQQVLRVLTGSGLATATSEVVTITDKGRGLAAKLTDAQQEAN